MARMKFICDAERCIECNGCSTACKQEHDRRENHEQRHVQRPFDSLLLPTVTGAMPAGCERPISATAMPTKPAPFARQLSGSSRRRSCQGRHNTKISSEGRHRECPDLVSCILLFCGLLAPQSLSRAFSRATN